MILEEITKLLHKNISGFFKKSMIKYSPCSIHPENSCHLDKHRSLFKIIIIGSIK